MSWKLSRAQSARLRSPRIETLEDRCLLSVAPPYTLTEYLAQFNGTSEVATLVKDDFSGSAGAVSILPNSALEICAGDSQWRGSLPSIAMLDGSGNLTGVDNETRYTCTNLAPIPANSLLAVNTTISFTAGNNAKLALGFAQGTGMLDVADNNSGPWVLINRNNTITLYTGSDTAIATGTFTTDNGPGLPTGFMNNVDQTVEFLYDVSTQSVHLTIGGHEMFGGWVDTGLGTGSDAVNRRSRFTMQIIDTKDDTPDKLGMFRDIDVSMITRPALTYLQDDFTGNGALSGSAREVDLQHTAWTGNAILSSDMLAGPDNMTSYASADLAPLGPNSVVLATSTFTFAVGGYQKVSYGFSSDANQFGANSGAWVQFSRAGSVTLYRGSTAVATGSYTFGDSTPYQMQLFYDVGAQQIAVKINGTTIAFAGGDANGWRDTGIGTGIDGELLRDRFTVQFANTNNDGYVSKVDDLKVQVLTRRPPKNDFTGADIVTMFDQQDAEDNTDFLWNLVNNKGRDNVIVKFAAGDYHFAASTIAGHSAATQVLLFSGLANVKFEGGPGVNIWIDDMSRGFMKFTDSTNVEVSDLHVDYTTTPWGQGTIKAINNAGHTITVEFDTSTYGGGTLVDLSNAGASGADVIWGYAIQKDAAGNPIPGQMDENTIRFITKAELVSYNASTGYFTLGLDGNASEKSGDTLSVGDAFILRYRYNGSSLFKSDDCADMTYRNLGIAAAPMVVFSGEVTEGINILNCWTEIKAGRLNATDGDAVHLRSPRIGPWVEGCSFTGIGDDVANLYTLPFAIESQTAVNNKTVLTLVKLTDYQVPAPKALGDNDFRAGDHLTFFNPDTGELMFTATVESVNVTTRQVTLNRLLTNGEIAKLSFGNTYRATTIFNDALATSYMILDNDWTNSYRSFNAKAHNGQFIGNYFANLGGPAISVHNEPDYPEGLVATNVIIKGNEFVNNGHQYNFLNNEEMCGTVNVSVSKQVRSSNYTALPLLTSDYYGPADIKILDNIFSEWRLRAITAFNVNRIDIIGNTFNDPKDNVGAGVPVGSLDRIVDVYRSANVTIDKSYYGGTPNNLVQRGTQTITGYGTITYYGFPTGSYLMAGGGESEAMLSTETLNALFDLVYTSNSKKDRLGAVDAVLADLN